MGDAAQPSQSWWQTFPALPSSVAEIRSVLREILRLVDGELDREDAVLMVSELASNAVRHGHSRQVDVMVELARGTLMVRVGDDSPVAPVAGWVAGHDSGGRGLALVDQLADQWGVLRRTEGKWVWFQSKVR